MLASLNFLKLAPMGRDPLRLPQIPMAGMTPSGSPKFQGREFGGGKCGGVIYKSEREWPIKKATSQIWLPFSLLPTMIYIYWDSRAHIQVAQTGLERTHQYWKMRTPRPLSARMIRAVLAAVIIRATAFTGPGTAKDAKKDPRPMFLRSCVSHESREINQP